MVGRKTTTTTKNIIFVRTLLDPLFGDDRGPLSLGRLTILLGDGLVQELVDAVDHVSANLEASML